MLTFAVPTAFSSKCWYKVTVFDDPAQLQEKWRGHPDGDGEVVRAFCEHMGKRKEIAHLYFQRDDFTPALIAHEAAHAALWAAQVKKWNIEREEKDEEKFCNEIEIIVECVLNRCHKILKNSCCPATGPR